MHQIKQQFERYQAINLQVDCGSEYELARYRLCQECNTALLKSYYSGLAKNLSGLFCSFALAKQRINVSKPRTCSLTGIEHQTFNLDNASSNLVRYTKFNGVVADWRCNGLSTRTKRFTNTSGTYLGSRRLGRRTDAHYAQSQFPSTPPKHTGVAQLAEALTLEASCCEFDSHPRYQILEWQTGNAADC